MSNDRATRPSRIIALFLVTSLSLHATLLRADSADSEWQSYRAKFRTAIYAQPSTRSDIVAILEIDQSVEVRPSNEGELWLRAGRGGEAIGYVFAPSVEEPPTRQPSRTEALALRNRIDLATAEFLERGLRAYDHRSYKDAYAVLLPLAQQGVADARFKIARMHHRGLYVPRNQASAVTWMELAAKQEQADALNDLGTFYQEGNGVPLSFEIAAMLYYRAANQGHCAAQLNIGGLFYNGDGVKKDYAQAAYWFSKASRCDSGEISRAGQHWLHRLSALARQRRQISKDDAVAAAIIFAIGLATLGSDSSSATDQPMRPCVPCSPTPEPWMVIGPCVVPNHPDTC